MCCTSPPASPILLIFSVELKQNPNCKKNNCFDQGGSDKLNVPLILLTAKRLFIFHLKYHQCTMLFVFAFVKLKENFHIIQKQVSLQNIHKVWKHLHVYALLDHEGALWFDCPFKQPAFYQFTQKREGLGVFLIPSKKESYLEENRCRFFFLTSKQQCCQIC